MLLVATLVGVRRWRPGLSWRLPAAELGLLVAATAAGTAMTRLLPPDDAEQSSNLVFLLGYDLPPQMGWWELATWWRIDLLFAPLAALGALTYLLGVRRLRRAGRTWPVARTASWLAGCAVVLVATSSGIGAYATAVFSTHLLGHALLSTLAPVLLVLAHPLTLARAAGSPPTTARIDALADAAPLRLLAHPAVAWCLAAAAVFGVYATGFFQTVVLEHWSHPVMAALALGVGLALFGSVLGARARQYPVFVRLGALFAVMMLHAAFAIWLLGRAEPLAAEFYTAVAMPFVPDLLADQQRGAIVAWVLSDLAMVGAALTLVRTWLRDTATDTGTVARPVSVSSSPPA